MRRSDFDMYRKEGVLMETAKAYLTVYGFIAALILIAVPCIIGWITIIKWCFFN